MAWCGNALEAARRTAICAVMLGFLSVAAPSAEVLPGGNGENSMFSDARKAMSRGLFREAQMMLAPFASVTTTGLVADEKVATVDLLYMSAARQAGDYGAVEEAFARTSEAHPEWSGLVTEVLLVRDTQKQSETVARLLPYAPTVLRDAKHRFDYTKLMVKHLCLLARYRDIDVLIQAVEDAGSNATLLSRVRYERGQSLMAAAQYQDARTDFAECERVATDTRLKSACEFYRLKCGLFLQDPEAEREAEAILTDNLAPPNRDDLSIALIEHYTRLGKFDSAMRGVLHFEESFPSQTTTPEYMHARLGLLYARSLNGIPPNRMEQQTVASYAHKCAEAAVRFGHPQYLRYDLACLLHVNSDLGDRDVAMQLIGDLWPSVVRIDSFCATQVMSDMPLMLKSVGMSSEEICMFVDARVDATDSMPLRAKLRACVISG